MINKNVEVAGWKDEDKWEEAQDKMIETMCRFEKAMAPHIKRLS